MFSRILLSLIFIKGFGSCLVKGLSLSPLPPHKIKTDKLFLNFFIFINILYKK